MKNIVFILVFMLLYMVVSIISGCHKSNAAKTSADANTICNAGAVTVTTNTVVTGGCIITGDLTILNGGTLNVDFTSATADTFVVRGNILLTGNALLWVHATPGSTGDQFILSSTYTGQRNITTKNSSRAQLENIEFRAQEGDLSLASSFDVNYDAFEQSTLYVNNSWLNTKASWILCNLHNTSSLIGYQINQVPTETYLQDGAQVALHGPGTNAGLWLNFENVNGTFNLPASQAQPFTWKIGRGLVGLDTQWFIELDTAQVGFGVQVFPSTKVTVNGSGLPATGEFKVAMMFSNNTDTIKNLTVGLQNTTVPDGPNGWVKLNNVNLGPIAWQLYALLNEKLYIKNSIVNEIGIAGPSNLVIDSCILQFGALDAVGIGGSTMTINNSDIYNQSISAANNSTITLNNCSVTGSAFSTTDATSFINVNGGCFFQNPAGCSEASMVNIGTGQPHCNPFVPPGFPTNLSPATVTFNGVTNNCMVHH